ncbi:MAG TPA: hypothetical protein VGR66_13655 [Candidatus Eisenbacteria bacterium]|jgi:hypothetical protein|nr:hypothetical protein [Candidatus Eisenbacteria bacterium]
MKRIVIVLAALALASCAGKKTDDSTERWVIVKHVAPGVSGMSDADAGQWHGRAIILGPDLAIAGPDSCARPMYHTGPAPADSVLQAFNVAPGSLGPSIPPQATVTITQTFCDGETWYAPGALIIRTSEKHAFTPWNGVFFELERR